MSEILYCDRCELEVEHSWKEYYSFELDAYLADLECLVCEARDTIIV